MNCLEKISRVTYSNDLVYDLMKLYKFNGRDAYYSEALKKNIDAYTKNTVEKDLQFAAKILDLPINDARLKLLIKKDSEPKTEAESMITNLKTVLQRIQEKGDNLILDSNEFLAMASTLYAGTRKKIRFVSTVIEVQNETSILTDRQRVSKRQDLDEELKLYATTMTKYHIEPTQVITNVYVDLLNAKVFTEENDFISLMICYALLVSAGFEVFKFTSFFELYYNHLNEFTTEIAKASYNWHTGYCNTDGLNRILVNFLLNGYANVEKIINDLDFDKKLSKKDLVASVILKLDTVFTRADIQKVAPTISESTINRALEELKKEGKIVSNGTGRSATWSRLVPDDMFTSSSKQLDIFAFTKGDE